MAKETNSHDPSCERAMGTTCACPCGGAGHHGAWITAITDDPPRAAAISETRKTGKLDAASLPVGRSPADQAKNGTAAIVADLVLDTIAVGVPAEQASAVRDLTRAISAGLIDEITQEMEATDRRKWPKHHFWCVGLAAICQIYDEGWKLVEDNVDSAVDAVLNAIQSEPDLHAPHPAAGVRVIGYKGRKRREAFASAAFDQILRKIVKHALAAVLAAIETVGEETAMRYVRLVGALVCPDPSSHAEVVNHCVWPLVKVPLAAGISKQLQTWLKVAYPYQPAKPRTA